MKSTPETVIGVDVGSGSVRAGIFDLSAAGCFFPRDAENCHRAPQRKPRGAVSAEIWQAVCRCMPRGAGALGTTQQSVAGTV